MRNLSRVFVVAVVTLVVTVQTAPAGELLPSDRSISDVVDHYIDVRLNESGVKPAPQADDANVARRTMLDLVGRIPTVGEVKSYIESSEQTKRIALVDRLIASPAFVRHQVNEFDTLLMYGSGGSLRNYLTVAISENRPWNQMFREMILGQSDDAEQKGAIQFVKSRTSDVDKLANQASVTFFGVNVSCAKCHDHPLVPEWTQNHFFGMKSFFSRTFDNGGLIGERDYGIVKYKTTKGEERTAQLMFLTGTRLDEPESKEPSGKEQKEEKKQLEELKKKKQAPPPPKFSRRAQLVDVALRSNENGFFAKSIVNKIWCRLFGHGLVMPLDQMHPENKPSHPELLEWLARDLIEHNYDLRRLTNGLVLSQTYARSSRWDDGDRPNRKLFAVANVRTLTPHQYAASLRIGSTNPDSFASSMKPEDFEKRIEGIENSSRGLAGLFEQPGDGFQISVTEALLFNNSDRVMKELLRDAADTLVGKLKAMDDRGQAIETAVWTIFSRSPDDEEVKLFSEFLDERSDRPVEAYQQLVWSMLTSSECRFNY